MLSSSTWVAYNDTNAVPGAVSKPDRSYILPNILSPGGCFDRCKSNATCAVWAWSPNTHNCYFRLDKRWAPGEPNKGYVSGCIESGAGAVWGCGYDPTTAACPSHLIPPASKPATPPAPVATRSVGGIQVTIEGQVGRTSGDFRMLGVNFDFWPPEKSKWSTCGVLTSRLDDTHLLPLVGRLRGSLLRIGGSPADFMLYDVFDGACSQANLNKTQPRPKTFQPTKYFCPIWDQVRGQCLTMPRWRAINEFAVTTGLRIAFDLNGCWGRENATSQMDMSMISGLFNVTAQLAASGASAVYAFQFTNEVYNQIEAARYGADLLELKRLLDAAWADHGASDPPTLVGPDNGWTDMSAAHLDGILNVSASVMAAATYHDYMNPCVDRWPARGLALNATCLDDALDGAINRYGAVIRRHATPLWLGEAGLHASSGVDGLTNVFTSSLWYAHALGRLARNGVGLMSRQTLLGGDYELINRTSGLPNPDYFVALLWHDLVGAEVMGVSLHGGRCGMPSSDCSKALRVHVHRAFGEQEDDEDDEDDEAGAGAVAVVMINFALETAFDLALSTSTSGGSGRAGGQLWQLTGQPASNRIFLNGRPLEVDVPGQLPPMHAAPCNPSKITLPPSSVTFCCLGCRRSVL